MISHFTPQAVAAAKQQGTGIASGAREGDRG